MVSEQKDIEALSYFLFKVSNFEKKIRPSAVPRNISFSFVYKALTHQTLTKRI